MTVCRKFFLVIYVTKVTDSDKPAGDRPAHEIEVTPEMVEAGATVLSGFHPDYGSYEEGAVEIFGVMLPGLLDQIRARLDAVDPSLFGVVFENVRELDACGNVATSFGS